MQKINGNLVYSASDMVNFLECKEITHLDLRNFDETLEKTADDPQAELIQKKGIAHEKAFLDKLTQQHPNSVIDIVAICPNKEAQYDATIKAMRDGMSIIYQASFRNGAFLGYADFLRRVEVPSKLGSYSYEIIDTKLSTKARSKYLIQLCLYAELLAEIQGVMPAYTYVVLGSGIEESFRVADYMHYFQSLKARFLDFIKTNTPIYPTPCDKCDLCHWKDRCNKRWNDDDHLSRVANISKVHIKRLEAAGINTLEELGSLPESAVVAKISGSILTRLREQASLQLKARTSPDEAPYYTILTPPEDIGDRPYGFSLLPMKNEGDMFFDMEGNPMEDNGLEYLFGLYIFENEIPQFVPFWAHNRAEEKVAFEQFIDYVTTRLRKYPDAYIYHYAPYETTAIKRLMGLHGTRELEVDNLLRKRKFVDLYKVVRESVRISEPSYSIKYLEHFYSEAREGDVQNAGASIVFYEKWKATQDESILQAIADYNEDDVRSTFELREWLLQLKSEAGHAKWFNLAKLVEHEQDSSADENSASSEKLQLIARTKSALQSVLPIDPKTWTHEQKARNLVAQLLEFFRRTAKPQWWAMFERQSMTMDEQLEDMECIAGLIPHPNFPAKQENRSIRYTYTYPEQDFKVKPGSGNVIAETLMSVSDLQIVEKTRTVSFKVSAQRELPVSKLTIATGGPINTDKLEEAVLRYATSILANNATLQSTYKAITSYLLRNTPELTGLKEGEKIINGRVHTEQIIDAAVRMNDTYMFLQGPPGAGKTYNGSEIILKLIQAKKRVGVTSNSHKAINNLLQAIDQKAVEKNILFKGFKKSNLQDKSQLIDGQIIKDTARNSDLLNPQTQLVAGTAWLFAHEDFDQKFDYVFIDEAGQISLAHLIAIGCSTKNIILLGDQMQLSQPIQGTHPDDSGLSSLEYLLQGKATIPAEQGIFLDTTRRMHSKVCKFISDVVYDSRLEADPSTDSRSLVLSANAHSSLKPAGISFVPITHGGNGQKSEEEALAVAEIYESLMQQSFKTPAGDIRKFTSENILVVAPYNAQVTLLINTLGPGARVGTVDKFQGQEAEVVIFSMTTSSEDELPRNMEFLFSRNRLNVAISRAKCLSIMLASPDLLEITCKKPEQMALVNTICWLKEYAAAD